ncbi:hypothetical protein GQ464_015975 [Rhodocaloribacter litoris]|uniref:hypothetical protein n=1 Tax=Rhodocaloribacter litoris TaxID=2558931 RepID=UPI001420B354|nr:hypothetical protein [Rhodocaloribacter litoris]QXD14895.1 hypothetical protein GQ464_015975 [Rhodocaloribacter litoris]
MQPPQAPRPSLGDSLTRWLLGFFGAVAAFLLLPRAVKYFLRRVLTRILGQVLLFVTMGLLTEKFVEWLSRAPEGTHTSLPNAHGS